MIGIDQQYPNTHPSSYDQAMQKRDDVIVDSSSSLYGHEIMKDVYGCKPELDIDDVMTTTIDDVVEMAQNDSINQVNQYLQAALDTVHDELGDTGFDVEKPSIQYNPLAENIDQTDKPAAQYVSRDDTIRIIRPSITDRSYPLGSVIGHEMMHKDLQEEANDLFDRIKPHGLGDGVKNTDGRHHLYGLLAAYDDTTKDIIAKRIGESRHSFNNQKIDIIDQQLAEKLEERRKESPLPDVNLVGLEEGLCHTFTLLMENRIDNVDEPYWDERAELYDDYDVPGNEIAHFGQQTAQDVQKQIEGGNNPMDAYQDVVDEYWERIIAVFDT